MPIKTCLISSLNSTMHTHAPTHTMHTCTRRGERRLIGLQDCWGRGRGGGLTFSQIKYESRGVGGVGGRWVPSQSGIKQRGLTNPPGYRPEYTHIHTHSHTHNAHINTHAHVCMCIASCVYMYVCAYTYTQTQKYCWIANTL